MCNSCFSQGKLYEKQCINCNNVTKIYNLDKKYKELSIVISEPITKDDYYYGEDVKFINVKNSAQIEYIMNPVILRQCENIEKISIHAHGSPQDNKFLYKSSTTSRNEYFISVSYVGNIIGRFLNAINVSDVLVECVVCFSADNCDYGKKLSFSRDIIRPVIKHSLIKGSLIDNFRKEIRNHCPKQFRIKGFTGQAARLRSEQKYRSTGVINAKYYFDNFDIEGSRSRKIYIEEGRIPGIHFSESERIDRELINEQILLLSELNILNSEEKKVAIDRIIANFTKYVKDGCMVQDVGQACIDFVKNFRFMNFDYAHAWELIKVSPLVEKALTSGTINFESIFKNSIRNDIDNDYAITINQYGIPI
ncbi:hypothetical protein IB642_07780 [Allofrancisella guangzhouensis]|uniref:hypothetical protein n=1 Tax=Allofrancisella guangzhouensis TaxID=594679 RepID=UPI0012FDD4C6|nr:hypothetical protein [Allofrancisella guangzhouensis]MBK2027675.1 hypothetical protein [Allofrancisella guangzhouensis]MBK2044911.1 hypothetical protein [Allofrancisella guangzhouensis]MBK2046436.1 hypothetical protein [Allofrancisella guangzhouensis]